MAGAHSCEERPLAVHGAVEPAGVEQPEAGLAGVALDQQEADAQLLYNPTFQPHLLSHPAASQRRPPPPLPSPLHRLRP